MPLSVKVEYLDNLGQVVTGNRRAGDVEGDDSTLRTDPEYLCMCRPFFFILFFLNP